MAELHACAAAHSASYVLSPYCNYPLYICPSFFGARSPPRTSFVDSVVFYVQEEEAAKRRREEEARQLELHFLELQRKQAAKMEEEER